MEPGDNPFSRFIAKVYRLKSSGQLNSVADLPKSLGLYFKPLPAYFRVLLTLEINSQKLFGTPKSLARS